MATKGELTKKKLISETFQLFHKNGVSSTSIQDIMAASGLKKGSIYFHFSGKDELGLAVINSAQEKTLREFKKHLTGNTPGECLINLLEGVVAKHQRQHCIGGCIFGNVALEMSGNNDEYTNAVSQAFSDWADLIKGFIQAAQDQGEIRPDIEAGVLADHIVITLEGGIMMARVRKDITPLKQAFENLKLFLGLTNSRHN